MFMRQFSDWKNNTKCYQKFYHKYWILRNEKKENQKSDTMDHGKSGNQNNKKRVPVLVIWRNKTKQIVIEFGPERPI